MKLFYTNADQFVNKIEELKLILADDPPDVIIITEVIPKAQILPITRNALTIKGYEAHMNFDPELPNLGAIHKRGVLIYTSQKIAAKEVEIEDSDFEEHIWCRINLKGKDTLLIGCVYRSPSSGRDMTPKLCNLISKVAKMNSPRMVIVGDFNYGDINWNNWSAQSGEAQQFIDCLQDNFLYQHVLEPTRYRPNQTPHILDLVITNEEGLIEGLKVLPGLGLSDHTCLSLEVKCAPELRKEKNTKKPNLNKGDYDELRRRIKEVDWKTAIEDKDLQSAWNFFKNTFNEMLDVCIPMTTISRKPKQLYLNKKALRIRRKKYYHFKKWKESDQYLDYLRYARERDALRNLTRKLCKDFEKDISVNVKKNPKAFWRYVNSKLKSRTTIGHLTRPDGTETKTDEETAEALNQFFSSVFTEEDLKNIPTLNQKYHGNPLERVQITTELITAKLKKLNPTKSPGPDNFHPRVLMETAEEISIPLSILFRKSLDATSLPEDWKLGEVVPIHKKGSRRQPGNYRPVSLTSVIGKVLESIVRDVLVDHMLSNQLFADEQHGFVPGRNCITQLLLVIEEWTDMLERGIPVDVAYLDFQKAFDSVPHQRLLRKVEAYGIKGGLRDWIEAFLSERKQRVKVNGSKSAWSEVKSGIPQGSCLGPTLFVIFINDLPDVIKSMCKIFADDTKAYTCMKCGEDSRRFQDDLEALNNWSDKWQLPFNLGKCKCMHMGDKNEKHRYLMRNTEVQVTTEEKDLGITIDDQLKFHRHTNIVVNKANQILGLIAKTFETLDEDSLPRLYKALVRPHLEYGNVIWGPRYVMDQQAVERVQRRATRLIPGLQGLPYEERLSRLNLPLLAHRRRRGDMIQCYKILTGINRINPDKLFQHATLDATRGHHMKLFKPRAKSEVRRGAFSVRVVDDWNSLPSHVVSAETVNQFKNRLDKIWKNDQYRSV